jgi:hypothetical protein
MLNYAWSSGGSVCAAVGMTGRLLMYFSAMFFTGKELKEGKINQHCLGLERRTGIR